MKAVISVAFGLALGFSLDAQISAKLVRSPPEVDQVRIRNDSSTNVVAFVVAATQAPGRNSSTGGPFLVFSDPLIEPAYKPLASGEERVAMVGVGAPAPTSAARAGARPIFEEPIVTAGVLGDGSTVGDQALLGRLVARRANMLLAVEMALETLVDAGGRNVRRDQLIGQFRKLVDSVRRWYLPPEQQVGRDLYQSIMGKLMNLPDVPLGAPFPPSEFVAEETAALNRQRVKLLESHPSLANSVATIRYLPPNFR